MIFLDKFVAPFGPFCAPGGDFEEFRVQNIRNKSEKKNQLIFKNA